MSDPNKELTPEQLAKIAGGINKPTGSSTTSYSSSATAAPLRRPVTYVPQTSSTTSASSTTV